MKIQTRYDIGDRVWVLSVSSDTYFWGKIVSFDIINRTNEIKIVYHIENRFYDENLYGVFFFGERNWRTNRYLDYEEDMVFSNEKELFDYVEANNDKQLTEMKELKKGFFS